MSGDSLIEAAESGVLEQVKAALAAVPHRSTEGLAAGKSPVLEALYRGHREVVDYLCRHWELDLHEASAVGDLSRVGQLLEANPQSVNSFNYDGWTPLHLASFLGHAEVAQKLVDTGADIGALSANGLANTPLHAALAGSGSRAVVEVLLGAGINVNSLAAGGLTPIHTAAARGSDELVDLLLAAGANPAVAMDDGKTPADIARERGHTALARRLEASA